MRLWCWGLLAIALQTACSRSGGSPVEKDEAIQIAQEYVKTHFPETNPRSRPKASDQGDAWVVRYEPPAGWFGGGPVVTIDKKSRNVTDAYAEQ